LHLEDLDVTLVPVDLLEGENIRVGEQLPHDTFPV
jgi:hypothetical protein